MPRLDERDVQGRSRGPLCPLRDEVMDDVDAHGIREGTLGAAYLPRRSQPRWRRRPAHSSLQSHNGTVVGLTLDGEARGWQEREEGREMWIREV